MNRRFKQVIYLIVSIVIINSCNSVEKKVVTNNSQYYNETNKCVKSIIQPQRDSISCLDCFIDLSKKYPDSLNPYLFIAEEYQKINDQEKLNYLYKFLEKKFGNKTQILYQKNFHSLLKFKSYDPKEIKILRERRVAGELTEQQVKDMGFLEMVILTCSFNKIKS
jgi:predicted O-linked N-acetylglucosamine transferase (SPINDLY family)